MTVYIEYVLINNLIIDYLLLKATFNLTGKSVSNGRLLFCAFLGAVFAILYPLVTVNKIIIGIAKVVFGFILTFIACKNFSLKSYYVISILFFIFTFLTGGALTGIYNLFGLNHSDEYLTAIAFIPVYFILNTISQVIKYVYNRRHVVPFTVNVELSLNGITKKCVGFFDTGNSAYDGDNPVIFCDKKLAEKFITQTIRIKKIKVKTVNGESENLSFNIEKIKIYIADKPHIFNNVTLCVTSNGVGDFYDLILHPALMESKNDYMVEKKNKKTA